MIRPTLLALAATLATTLATNLPLPGPARAGEGDHAHNAHLARMGDVRLLHAWARATTGDTALVFVEIENAGQTPVSLIGGEAGLAASVTLVGFQMKGGTGGYVALPALPIAAGRTMALAPEGVALRLEGLNRPLAEGESFEMEVEFAEGHAALACRSSPPMPAATATRATPTNQRAAIWTRPQGRGSESAWSAARSSPFT